VNHLSGLVYRNGAACSAGVLRTTAISQEWICSAEQLRGLGQIALVRLLSAIA
jgi:hypothetical protein